MCLRKALASSTSSRVGDECPPCVYSTPGSNEYLIGHNRSDLAISGKGAGAKNQDKVKKRASPEVCSRLADTHVSTVTYMCLVSLPPVSLQVRSRLADSHMLMDDIHVCDTQPVKAR